MTSGSDQPLISVRDLTVTFKGDEGSIVTAVHKASFDIPPASTVGLVGESGSGKSVTALAMVGLLPQTSARVDPDGKVLYAGRNLLALSPAELRALRGADIAMIFQDPMSSLNPVFSVGFQLGEVLAMHRGLSGRALRARCVELLREVGIPDPETRVNAYPFELSGGQQQRVMIAMAIACEPKLLIADEPTTALDVTVQKQILELIAALQKRLGMSVLFISHDLALVGEIADHVIVMRDGEIREQGDVRQIFDDPRDPYTRALLKCRPRLDRRPRRLPVIDDFLSGVQSPGWDDETSQHRFGGDIPIVLEARNLGKGFISRKGLFKKSEFKAVQGVSFRLRKGETLGVVGESGSGKTTAALALMRLHDGASGGVLFGGKNLLTLSPTEMMPYKRRIQIVFQNPYASLNPRMTVGRILMEPMQIHGIGADESDRREMASDLLRKVGLPPDSWRRYPHEFSGGQRQRIAIARCLTLKPEILICDEAVSALDVSVQAQILNLLKDLQDEYRMSYIFISHDLAVVRYMADQVMVMTGGAVVELASADEIYLRPQHVYTRALLASVQQG